MEHVTLDQDGRLAIPESVRQALGWEVGAALAVKMVGGELVISPASASEDLKAQARRLASEMRSLGGQGLRKALGALEGARTSAARNLSHAGEAFCGLRPVIPASCYIAAAATVIGNVALGDECSVWPGAVVRGDMNEIRVGARTNVQDGAVLHVSPGEGRCVVGSGVTIGHQAVVHACEVADNVLIGMHSVILDGAKIGEHCIIGAGAVVTPGTEIPSGKLVLGVPGKPVRDLTPDEVRSIYEHADAYVGLRAEYLNPTQVAPPAAAEPAAAAAPAPGNLPKYEVRRAAGAITIDGSLDDPGWAGIAPMSAFRLASDGGEPRYETQCKAAWDDKNLYVAFSSKDVDIWGTLKERDADIYTEEVVEVFLCPTNELRHYFEYEVSPNNVVLDLKVFSPDLNRRTMLTDREWNSPGWKTAARVSGTIENRSDVDLGWIVEMAIPWEDLELKAPPKPGDRWRANFYRIEHAGAAATGGNPRDEFTAWSPTLETPPSYHVPKMFGELIFAE